MVIDFLGSLGEEGQINCKIVLDILQKPPGFDTTAREPKRAHLRPRSSKTPPKFNEKTPKRRNENCGGSAKKKGKILGGPAEGGPAEGGPTEGGPTGGFRGSPPSSPSRFHFHFAFPPPFIPPGRGFQEGFKRGFKHPFEKEREGGGREGQPSCYKWTNAEELWDWMSRKQNDFQELLEFGGSRNAVFEWTSQLADAAERMHSCQDRPNDVVM